MSVDENYYVVGYESNDDSISEQEADALLHWYSSTHGLGNTDLTPFVPFLIREMPSVFKRYRRQQIETSGLSDLPTVAGALMFMVYYASTGSERGVLYEVVAAREWGASRSEVLSAVEFAFLRYGPQAANTIALAAGDYLADWQEDPEGSTWAPETWTGVGLSTGDPDGEHPSTLDSELQRWDERSSVPGGARGLETLESNSPGALRAWQRRVDLLEQSALPRQWRLMTHVFLATIEGRVDEFRIALHKCEGVGIERSHLIEIIWWAFLYVSEPVKREIMECFDATTGDWSAP